MASILYKTESKAIDIDKNKFVNQLKEALYSAMLLCYGQGFSLLQHASTAYAMQIPLQKVVRVWRGGCIIRSSLLEIFIGLFDKQPGNANILLDENVAAIMQTKVENLREIVCIATQHAYPVPAFSNCINYFDAYRTGRLPANLLQAQRDYFGAHTYERVDEAGNFHTEWGQSAET